MRVWENLRSDVRIGIRSLVRDAGFTSAALLTLVVGIAAVASIFSYMNAIYYAKLPYADANRIVGVAEQRPGTYPAFNEMSLNVVRWLKAESRSFERIVEYRTAHPVVVFGRAPQQITVLGVDSGFVGMFRIRPSLGRNLSAEDAASVAPVTMISDAIWRSYFGADSSVLGRRVVFGAREVQVIGVLPVGFRFPWQTDAIVPLDPQPDSGETEYTTTAEVIAKLRPGVSRSNAQVELNVLADRRSHAVPRPYQGVQFFARSEMLDRKGRLFLPAPWFVVGAGIFLLLIASANVANLLLVRAAMRRREMAIRASLGAPTARLLGQVLVESLLLSGLAAAIGTLAATVLVRLWLRFVPAHGFPSWFRVEMDWRVLAFSIAITGLVTVAVGMSPALEAARFDLVRMLKSGGDGAATNSRVANSGRRGVVLQLSLSMALFVGASLLFRSFSRLSRVDVGYPADQIARIAPLWDPTRYPHWSDRLRVTEDVVMSVRDLPQIGRVAVRGDFVEFRGAQAGSHVMTRFSSYDPRLIPDGDTSRALRRASGSAILVVSDDYFSTIGLTVRAGRSFTAADVAGASPVAVISASLAKSLWGSSSPIGRVLQQGARGDRLAVVGVVDDVRDLVGGRSGYTADPRATVYLSVRQAFSSDPFIVARPRGDVAAARAAVVSQFQSADANLLIRRGETLASQFDEAILTIRLLGRIVVAFAASALLLSVLGIYGVVAFSIEHRTREIGIRLALGGTRATVRRMIVRETSRFVAVGIVIGLCFAMLLANLLRAFLFGVSSFDLRSYAAVTLGFGAVAIAACYIPALRATKIEPTVALRAE